MEAFPDSTGSDNPVRVEESIPEITILSGDKSPLQAGKLWFIVRCQTRPTPEDDRYQADGSEHDPLSGFDPHVQASNPIKVNEVIRSVPDAGS